jgi:N-acylneuraminate cytidylyltransferase
VPDQIAFIQATSPIIDVSALASAVQMVDVGEADVAFSVVASHAFLWRKSGDRLVGVNHDPSTRPRRQDREPEFRETGSFYVMRVEGFVAAKHRFFGLVKPVLTTAFAGFEIDEPSDLEIARNLVASLDEASVQLLDEIKVLVTDFDGVHTDDTAYVDQFGNESVRVSRSDGLGISRLVNSGIKFLILSRESNPVVKARARKLNVECISGSRDKASALQQWLRGHGVHERECAYVGNDLNDLECLNLVGLRMAPSTSHDEVIKVADFVLSANPGDGLVREACEFVLKLNDEFRKREERSD